MKRILLWFVVFFLAREASAQIVISSLGKEFYCMVMKYYGTPEAGADPFGTNHYVRVFLSSQFAATVTVQSDNPPFQQTVTLSPNVTTTIELDTAVEVTDAETPSRKSIHIVADTNISAYVIYHKKYSTDSYMALPVTALGSEYIAACYPSSVQDFGGMSTGSEVGVVATSDSTEVTFTTTGSTFVPHALHVPFTVTLNKGDAYLLYGNRNDEFSDLTGTTVSSTKPIAVFSGHERAGISFDSAQSRDCLVEQIPPTQTLGTSFITVPFNPRTPAMFDLFRIVAPVDSTVVMVNGSVVATINTGQFVELKEENPMQIQTSNPVLLAQYAISATDVFGRYSGAYLQWDPAMMIVPPTQQFLSEYTFANAEDTAFKSSYVNVVIPDTAVSSLRLDGGPLNTAFTSIPGSGYSYGIVRDSQGSHHIVGSAPFGIYVYGYGEADSYANTGGAAFRTLNGLLVTTNDLDFGGVTTDTCRDSTVVFGNQGNAPITVWTIWLADSAAGDFSIISGKPPFTIAPGDSHVVHIRFCPSAVGVRGLAHLRFSSNAIERPVITVHGIGKKIGVDADVEILDFHRVLVNGKRDSSYMLKNVGSKTAIFAGLTITGPDTSMFTMIGANAGMTLLPGDSQIVQVRFIPTSVGIKHANIATFGSTVFYASVDLVGEGIAPGLSGEPDLVDYQIVKIKSTRDSLLVARSVGTAPTSIGGYSLGGPDANQFVIVYGPGGRTLPTGDTVQVNVRFAPTSPGVKSAELDWKTAAENIPIPLIQLRGTAMYSSVGILPKIVDFGKVKITKPRDSVLTTSNTGAVEAQIFNYTIAGTDAVDFKVVQQTTPATLAPSGSQQVTAEFAPQTIGAKHAQLIVSNDGNTADTIAELYGNGRQNGFAVTTATDTIQARIGDTIHVPVRLIGALDDADIVKYRILLGFNSTMLYPLAIHGDTTWSASTFSPVMNYAAGVADVQATSGSTLLGEGPLYTMDMLVLLGNALQTPLTFSAAKYIDIGGDSTGVATALNMGLFQLVEMCDTNSLITSSAKPLTLSPVTPNPLSSNALISFDLPALGPVHLALMDMLGRESLTLVNEERPAGHYATILPAGRIPSGAYTLVLQAGRFREMRRVEIVR